MFVFPNAVELKKIQEDDSNKTEESKEKFNLMLNMQIAAARGAGEIVLFRRLSEKDIEELKDKGYTVVEDSIHTDSGSDPNLYSPVTTIQW